MCPSLYVAQVRDRNQTMSHAVMLPSQPNRSMSTVLWQERGRNVNLNKYLVATWRNVMPLTIRLMIGSLVSCSTSFRRCFPVRLITLPLIFAPAARDPEIIWGPSSQRMLRSLQRVSEEALSMERRLPGKRGVSGAKRCIPMWSCLPDDNTPLIGQLIWWAELYCTLSASSSLAKTLFFFCSTSLLYLVSKCIRVLAVLQKHVLVNSAPPSSTLHPSRSRISLGRTRGRARGSVGFSLPLHPR